MIILVFILLLLIIIISFILYHTYINIITLSLKQKKYKEKNLFTYEKINESFKKLNISILNIKNRLDLIEDEKMLLNNNNESNNRLLKNIVEKYDLQSLKIDELESKLSYLSIKV